LTIPENPSEIPCDWGGGWVCPKGYNCGEGPFCMPECGELVPGIKQICPPNHPVCKPGIMGNPSVRVESMGDTACKDGKVCTMEHYWIKKPA